MSAPRRRRTAAAKAATLLSALQVLHYAPFASPFARTSTQHVFRETSTRNCPARTSDETLFPSSHSSASTGGNRCRNAPFGSAKSSSVVLPYPSSRRNSFWTLENQLVFAKELRSRRGLFPRKRRNAANAWWSLRKPSRKGASVAGGETEVARLASAAANLTAVVADAMPWEGAERLPALAESASSKKRESTRPGAFPSSFLERFQLPSLPKTSFATNAGPSSTAATKALPKSAPSSTPPPKSRASQIIETAIENLVTNHALHTCNFSVKADRAKTDLLPLVLRGRVGSVAASFDRLAFHNIMVSGGGQIVASDVSLSPASFAPWGLGKSVRRFTTPFRLHAKDCVFTQEDVRNSSSMRNGLQALARRIVRRAFVSNILGIKADVLEGAVKVTVNSVDVLANDKLSCSGFLVTKLGARIPFEVRTGVRASPDGRVLQFPGLEMIAHPDLPIPVQIPLHLLQEVTLYVGKNARFDDVEIDGRRRQVRLSVKATITPGKKDGFDDRKQQQQQRKGTSFPARYSCDIGEWLTNIGRFSKL